MTTTTTTTTPRHRRVVTATALGRRHRYQIPFRHQKPIATTTKNEEPSCLCYDCPPQPLPLKRSAIMPYLGSASFPLERMPYCGLVSSGINNPSDTDDDDDDEDNSSRSSEPSVDYYSTWGSNSNGNGNNTKTTSSSNNSTRWIAKLLQISNVASALCVLDCTVLPVLMVALPMTTGIFFVTTTASDDDHDGGGAAAAEAAQEWLHALGHRMALCFVLPVGLLTTSLNFLLQHGNARILALGLAGLCLILAANADAASCHDDGHDNHHHLHDHSHDHHHHFHSWHWFHHNHDHHQLSHRHHHHHGGQDSSRWLFSDPMSLLPNYLAQLWALVTNHHGIAHRITNVLGCTLMFASNYLSRKKHAGCSDPNCKW